MNRKDRHFAIGSVVKHFKGRVYRIEEFAKNTETSRLMVIYRQMYPPFQAFARDEEEFCSEVDHKKYPTVEQKYCFEKLTIAELYGYKDIPLMKSIKPVKLENIESTNSTNKETESA